MAKLEKLFVNIPGQVKDKPFSLEHAEETFRLVNEFIEEFEKIKDKCFSLTKIDGHQLNSIAELRLTGKSSVENVGLTYTSENQEYSLELTKNEFYES